jgi:hypothetical protein
MSAFVNRPAKVQTQSTMQTSTVYQSVLGNCIKTGFPEESRAESLKPKKFFFLLYIVIFAWIITDL